MRHRRTDVVARALAVLDTHGLGDLTMRRLGAELGVQPSALYHHFATKQLLLAAVADEILARGTRAATGRPAGRPGTSGWSPGAARCATRCSPTGTAPRSWRPCTPSVSGPARRTTTCAPRSSTPGSTRSWRSTAARTLLHFVFGHTADEQTHLQAGSAGAIADAPRERDDFDAGLALVVDGIALRVGALR